MIKRLITIGSDPVCDFVINRQTWPTLADYIVDSIIPLNAEIIQDDEGCYLVPFKDNVYVNGTGVTFILERVTDKIIVLDYEDRISVRGLDIYWQQWIEGLGLRCDNCMYLRYRLQDDDWCKCCKEHHGNPAPYIYGYSWKFDYSNKIFFNYTDCNRCRSRNTRFDCCECTSFQAHQPKDQSYKAHMDMYMQRLKEYEFYNRIRKTV